MGVYLHEIFENTAYRQTFLRSLGWDGQSFDWNALVEGHLEKAAGLIVSTGWDKYFVQDH